MTHDSQPLVSVCVPTYNRAATYLRAALDSILTQTYKNLEVIISDNASPDDTEVVCREYARKDPRVKYIRQKTNIGPCGNMNFLRRQISGEYFLQASDDDIWLPTFLEKCVMALENDQDAICAGTNFVEFDDKGREVVYSPELYYPSERAPYKRLKQFILFMESDAKVMFLYSGVWRSRAVLGYKLTEYWGWDMNFVFRGLTMGPFLFIDEVLFRKRINPTALDPPQKKFFIRRIFDSLWQSRIRRILSPFFYVRSGFIVQSQNLTMWEKGKLLWWNFFAATRLFWSRKI